MPRGDCTKLGGGGISPTHFLHGGEQLFSSISSAFQDCQPSCCLQGVSARSVVARYGPEGGHIEIDMSNCFHIPISVTSRFPMICKRCCLTKVLVSKNSKFSTTTP